LKLSSRGSEDAAAVLAVSEHTTVRQTELGILNIETALLVYSELSVRELTDMTGDATRGIEAEAALGGGSARDGEGDRSECDLHSECVAFFKKWK